MILEGLQPRQVHTAHMQFNTLSETSVHVATSAVQVGSSDADGAQHATAAAADVVSHTTVGYKHGIVVASDDRAGAEFGADGVFELSLDP